MSEFSLSEFIFELPSTEEFLINVPLYKSFETNFINIDRVKEYVNYRGPIDLFCTECNQLSVFKSNRPVGTDDGRTGKKAAIDTIPPFEYKPPIGYDAPTFFTIELICSRNDSHKVHFQFHHSRNKIQKIGQLPSYADLQEESIKKYKNILNARYIEFAKAIGLVSHGIGIGSFVYLRRIFESLIEEAHSEAKMETDWDEEQFISLRMEEKIKHLKNFLPAFLIENYSIYSILSKGIHSLTEDECLEY